MNSQSHVDSGVIDDLTMFWVVANFMNENIIAVPTQN